MRCAAIAPDSTLATLRLIAVITGAIKTCCLARGHSYPGNRTSHERTKLGAVRDAENLAACCIMADEDEGEIVIAAGNFHGRTTTLVDFSDAPVTRGGFGPFTPGFVTVPFGDEAALRVAVTERTAAVLLDPVQGEAGVIIPPKGYLQAAREACDERGALLIPNEIQSGLGCTGKRSLVSCSESCPTSTSWARRSAAASSLSRRSSATARSSEY